MKDKHPDGYCGIQAPPFTPTPGVDGGGGCSSLSFSMYIVHLQVDVGNPFNEDFSKDQFLYKVFVNVRDVFDSSSRD